MRKYKIVIIVLSIFLFISLGIMTYAYFIKKIEGGTHGISSNSDDSKVITVVNYNEFIQAVRLYDDNNEFNSDNDISASTTRKTIKLMDNIRLKSNVLIDADCHIDLNNYTLDLAGYDIVFRYRFDGSYYVYGGIIDDSSILDEEGNIIENAECGNILIDCPKENFTFDTSLIKEGININVSYATDEQIAVSAMNMVLANIQDIGINDFYNIRNSVNSVTHYGCTFSHSEGTMCIYTYTDLDLIYNYLNYEDMIISYSSSNKEVLSDEGNVIVGSTPQTTDLTITISYKDCELLEKKVSVHILVKNSDYLSTSNILLQKYLSKYYNANLGALNFDTSFLLPKSNSYLGVTYSYKLLTANSEITSEETSKFFDGTVYDDYFLVSLTSEITGIEVTSTKSGESITTDVIPVNGESSTVIDDNHSYAVNIARTLYNNQFLVEKIGQSTYTEFDNILVDPTEYGYTRIESITNRLVNNEDETYELVDESEFDSLGNPNPNYQKYQTLKVNEDSEIKPYVGQTVFLEITFEFKQYYDGDIVVVQVPIIFKPYSESGQNFPTFAPFYTYFDKEFSKVTKNYGYESFSMPLSYDGNKDNPIYTFVVLEKVNGEYVEVESPLFKQGPEDVLETGFTKDTLKTVTIDPKYIDINTKDYYFAYVPIYLFNDKIKYYDTETKGLVDYLSQVTINIDYPYISKLTIPGIVRYGTGEEFADKDFYIMAYNLLSYDTYEEGKYLLSSDLENYIEIIDFSSMSNFSFSGTDNNGKIDSLKGINLMKGISVLDFEGKLMTTNGTQFVTELGYISEITNLKILNLASTGIYDCTQSNLAMPEGSNNNFLSSLSKLNNLEELYLQNNKIFYFDSLVDFAALKKVDISNNKFTATITYDFIATPMTNLSNSLYGSLGANNISAVATLTSKGVDVIQGSQQAATLQQDFVNIVTALSSLQYQDRLDSNINLEQIASLYLQGTRNSSNASDIYVVYNIPQAFVLENNTEITFTFEDLTIEPNNSDNGLVMTIHYSWAKEGIISGATGNVYFTYEYRIARY